MRFATRVIGAMGVLAGALLSACSGNDSTGASGIPATLAGQWQVWMTLQGQEIGPYATCLTQDGNTLGGVGLSGNVNGRNFSVVNNDLGGVVVEFRGSANGNQASGTLNINHGALSGAFRMQTFDPRGTLTMAGAVSGTTTAVTTSIASGRREYTDAARTQLNDLEVAFDDGLLRTHLTFSAAGFGLGTLAVGTGGIRVVLAYETGSASVDATATGGSLVIRRYDTSGMAGSYNLTFAGGSVSGSFDVDWDLDAYQPPQ